MYGCESWTMKKAECRRIDAFELWCWRRLLRVHPVHSKGDQSWVFIGRIDVEAETPILWTPDAKSWLLWKEPDAGEDWRQEEKRMTGWDGRRASLTQWTWVWINSRSWWWTGRPWGRRAGHNGVSELDWLNGNSTLPPQSSLCHDSSLIMRKVIDKFQYKTLHRITDQFASKLLK